MHLISFPSAANEQEDPCVFFFLPFFLPSVFPLASFSLASPASLFAASPCPIWPPPQLNPRGGQKSKYIKKKETLYGGSTNMPLFGRVYECKEYEHWSEKQVWIVSVMKWTLPKDQGDPHRDTNETRTHSGQKTNNEALILKGNEVSKCLWKRLERPWQRWVTVKPL